LRRSPKCWPTERVADSRGHELETAKYRYDVENVIEDPSTEVLELLLRAGADPRLTDDRGHDAFYWARDTGNYAAEAVLRAWVPTPPPPKLR
jgi:hypothetical protein